MASTKARRIHPENAIWFDLGGKADETSLIVPILQLHGLVSNEALLDLFARVFESQDCPVPFRSIVEDAEPLPHFKIIDDFKVVERVHFHEMKEDDAKDVSDQQIINDFTHKLTTVPFDLTKPLWEVNVLKIPSRPSFGTILVFKVHHTLGDGTSLLKLLEQLCIEEQEPVFVKQGVSKFEPLHKWSWFKMLGPILHTVFTMLWFLITTNFALLVRKIKGLPNQIWIFPEQKKEAHSNALATLGRESLPKISEIKAAAKKYGATVNDMLLAVYAGALRKFAILHHGANPNEIPDCFLAGVAAMHNLLTSKQLEYNANFDSVMVSLPFFLLIPTSKDSHSLRVKTVKARMDVAKKSLVGLLDCPTRDPTMAERRKTAERTSKGLKSCPVTLTNLMGPSRRLKLCGTYLDSVSFVATSGAHSTVSVLSYNDGLCVSLYTVGANFNKPQVLLDIFAEELKAACSSN
eukprot:TRINITY_DN3980_c0_g1_i1.p1 TRINITY_DN3980_c0_g1~~TRINITY_DN3980_c0_g1_i1.p1  ORF type:complete len:463 (+),score=117.70 TRINITY_DN3980_c0_g1_i1:1834-3222(+)